VRSATKPLASVILFSLLVTLLQAIPLTFPNIFANKSVAAPPPAATITGFNVQVRSGNTAYIPHGTDTSLLSANFAPRITPYQYYKVTVGATGSGTLTWRLKTGSTCEIAKSVAGTITGQTYTLATTSTYDYFQIINTGTRCVILEVINTVSGESTITQSTYGFNPTVDTAASAINSSPTFNGAVGQTYTNASQFTATGGRGPWKYYISPGNLPAGLTLNEDTGAVTGTYTTAGSGILNLRAIDQNGYSLQTNGGSNIPWTVAAPGDVTAPTITRVTAVHGNSTPANASPNGPRSSGDRIIISFEFSEIVSWTGTPQLTLETGATNKVVDRYPSTNNVNKMDFWYTVADEDDFTDLDYISSNALSLNSGTIKDASGNNAILTLPTPGSTGSLSATYDISMNGRPFVVSFSSTTPDGYYKSGSTINVTATLSEPVTTAAVITATLRNSSGTSLGTVALTHTIEDETLSGTFTVSTGTATQLYVLSYALTNAPVDLSGRAMTSLVIPNLASGNNFGGRKIVVDTTAPNSFGTYVYPTGSATSVATKVVTFRASAASDTIDCQTLSKESNVDFAFAGITAINSITQLSTQECLIEATSSATAGSGATTVRLTKGAAFAFTDLAGNDSTANPTTFATYTVTITDITAPTISATSTSLITQTTARFSFTPSESGTYYYLIYPSASAPPTIAAVIAQSEAVPKGAGPVTNVAKDVDLTGLTPSTAYRAYIVVTDTAGNNSNLEIIEITTLAPPVPAPTIISFTGPLVGTPNSAAFGSTITITGTNFTNATSVKQGSAEAVFTVNSPTSITFTVSAAVASESAVSVTTSGGTAVSSTNLTVLPQIPIITAHPQSVSKAVGSSTTFSVTVTPLQDGGVLTYQWKKGTSNIAGATLSTYTFVPTSVADGGNYSVTVTNTNSNSSSFVISDTSVLTMTQAVTTTTFSASNTAPLAGTSVTLVATVTSGATGVVLFKDASNNILCTTSALSSTRASCTWTPTVAGTYVVSATYEGDTNYATSTSSTTNIVVSNDTPPGAPTIDSIAVGSGSLTITFTEGTNTGSLITNYAYSTDGGTTYKVLPLADTTSPITITTISSANTNLINGTSYSVRIKALNTVYGAASNAVSATPLVPSVPGNVTGTMTVPTPKSLNSTITFTVADNGGSPVTKIEYWYRYSSWIGLREQTSWITVLPVNGVFTSALTVLPCRDYSIYARATNNNGTNSGRFAITFKAPIVCATYRALYSTGGAGFDDETGYEYYSTNVPVKANTGNLVRAGYTFAGWTDNLQETGTVYQPGDLYTASNTTITFIAKWTPNTLSVTYNSQGGSVVSSGSVLTGSAISAAPTQPTRDGYVFNGWFVASSGGSAIRFPYTPTATSSFTLYAQWSANTLTVSYDTQGGSTIVNGSVKTGANILVNPGTPTKSGFTFAGWFTASTGGSALTFPYTHNQTANFTLYGQWNVNTYTVTYRANGATSGDVAKTTDTYTVGGPEITLLTVGLLVKTGYNFSGWSTTGTGTGLTGSYSPTSNVTLYAVWTPISYTIIYQPDGGETTPTQSSLNIGQSFNLANAITKPSSGGVSYQFVGWSDGNKTYQAGSTFTVGSANLTFTAIWAVLYQVKYTLNGGVFGTADANDGAQKASGDVITLATAPTRSGYTFTGWKNQSSQSFFAQGVSYTITSTNYLLYAQWEATVYTVTYVSNGSIAPTQSGLTIGESFTVGAAVTRSGYVFNGWNDGTRIYSPGAAYVISSSNVTLTADWIPNTYTVTYDWNGSSGTATSPSTYTVGRSSAITLPVVGDQIRSNHSFDGWSLTRNGAKINSLTYTPTSSLTLYAIWNKSIYTITYGAQGGSVAIASEQIEADGAGVILPAATKSNFFFKGWYDATTGGNLIGAAGASYLPTSSKSIYAQWVQSSLAGFTEAELGTELFSGTKRASGVTQTFTFSTSGDRSYMFVVPGSALPNNTALNFYQVASPSSIARAAITDPVNYILSVIVSWLDPTGAVPDTADGKPIKIIVSDPAIKRGAVIYGVVAGVTQRLATATANGTVTVEITQDPEIIVAKTKPSAPRGVSASDSTSGISTVAWTEPATTGGDDISIYQVTASPGGATCTTTTTSCQITGLSDTTRYSFTVDATNSVGTGSTSLASNLINAPVESSPSPSSNNPVRPTETLPIVEKTDSLPIKNEQPSYAMQKIGTIYFTRNSYFLDLKARKELQSVINLVNKDLPIKVLVYGHTDVTTGVNNLILSRSRAKAVEKYMSTKINGPKISTGWYASSKPAIKGSSATALAKNRRVDIYILY
jgi:uncharacterized repeat protein (TIGR02543 family)